MRLAAVLLVSFLTFAASAQAATARGPKSPEETAAYWTKERMQSAIPRDVVRGGEPKATRKPGGGGTTSSWSRVAVTPIPYTGLDLNNGKVFFTLGTTNYVCSGTSVATATTGISLVWTAGHCTTDGPGKDATNFTFVPGYLDGTTPKGKWVSGGPVSTEDWREHGNFEYDFGAARVTPVQGTGVPSGVTTLGQIATPRSMIFGGANSSTLYASRFNSYGYPAAGKFNGQRMYMCDSPVLRRDDSAMGIGCDMTGGSSGGGWIDPVTKKLGSVNSYHYMSLKNVMFGPYQGPVAQELYESMD